MQYALLISLLFFLLPFFTGWVLGFGCFGFCGRLSTSEPSRTRVDPSMLQAGVGEQRGLVLHSGPTGPKVQCSRVNLFVVSLN
jgi:hypothetical protein